MLRIKLPFGKVSKVGLFSAVALIKWRKVRDVKTFRVDQIRDDLHQKIQEKDHS